MKGHTRYQHSAAWVPNAVRQNEGCALCVSTRNYGNWWRCSVMARACARPVLCFGTVPDQVIHMPSWANGWAQARKSTGSEARFLTRSLQNLSSTVLEGCLRIDIAWQVAWPIDKSTTDQEPTPWTMMCYIGPALVGRRASKIATLRVAPRGGRCAKGVRQGR